MTSRYWMVFFVFAVLAQPGMICRVGIHLSNLSSQISGMGEAGSMGRNPGSVGAGLKTKRKDWPIRDLLDGSFVSAKNGALEWERLRGATVPRSWQSQTEMVFLSPFVHMKRTHTRLSSLKKSYLAALLE